MGAVKPYESGNVKSIILAGGHGERLRGICDPKINKWAYPKPSLAVGPSRIIDFSINALHALGARDVSFATFHLAESIEFLARNRAKELGLFTECILETEKRDTAGATKYIIELKSWHKGELPIIILSADIIHNMDLINPLEHHIEKQAAATIVVNPLPWIDMYRFGSVRIEGMPERSTFKTDEEFQDANSEWVSKNLGTMKKIFEFREKRPASYEDFMRIMETNLKEAKDLKRIYEGLAEKHKEGKKEDRVGLIRDDIQRSHIALSTLNNSSMYFTSPYFWRAFIPFITFKGAQEPFSDFGGHIFRALSARAETELAYTPISKELRGEILAGRFPFYAYVMPEKNNYGKSSYWVDAGVPSALLEVNKDVLRGLIYVGIGQDKRFKRGPNNTWVGDNTFISELANIVPLMPGAGEHEISSILSHHVVVGKGAKIERSVIGSYVEVGEGAEVVDSVIMSPHFRKKDTQGQVKIGPKSKIRSSIVIGADIEPGKEYAGKVVIEPEGGVVLEDI